VNAGTVWRRALYDRRAIKEEEVQKLKQTLDEEIRADDAQV
jgi:hypothetical protein